MNGYPDMKITGRIVQDRQTIGYVVVDTTGVPKKLRRQRVIELAQQEKFINAAAYQKDGLWGLKGINNTNLTLLPVYKVKTPATN